MCCVFVSRKQIVEKDAETWALQSNDLLKHAPLEMCSESENSGGSIAVIKIICVNYCFILYQILPFLKRWMMMKIQRLLKTNVNLPPESGCRIR